MAPYERELCGLFSGLGANFGSSTIIKHEFDAEKLERYIGLFPPLSSTCQYLGPPIRFFPNMPLVPTLANHLSMFELLAFFSLGMLTFCYVKLMQI